MPTTTLLSPLLVVDDEADDIFFIRRLLGRTGVENPVITFTDSSDALAFLRALADSPEAPLLTPCVMFMDIKMPTIHGFVLLKWVRSQPYLETMKVAVLSGSDEPKDRLRAEKLGADHYLVKFPEPEVLADVVAAACGALA